MPQKSESEVIRRAGQIFAPLAPAGLAVPYGDDMAAVGPAWPAGLWTVDMLMDGVDFDSRIHGWRDIGYKALAVNLSDCAAMAARPAGALVAVALCDALEMNAVDELLIGLHECAARFGCPILGGDTNSWPQPTVVSVTVAATCQTGRGPLRRDGARPGDSLWLTGPVGGSILGRHLRPEPRLALAEFAAGALSARAAVDVSDGLALDLHRMMAASGCAARLNGAALPTAIHDDAHAKAARNAAAPLDCALFDGEDFELILALPSDVDAQRAAAAGLLRIGTCEPGRGVAIVWPDGRRVDVPARGWEHFR